MSAVNFSSDFYQHFETNPDKIVIIVNGQVWQSNRVWYQATILIGTTW